MVELAPERLAGEYALAVVATTGGGGDTLARSRLTLRPTTVRHRAAWLFPLWGWTDGLELDRLGKVSLLYEPSVRDSVRPGVQVMWERGSGLVLVAGNAYTLDEHQSQALDAGVIFRAAAVDTTGIVGHWTDGGFNATRGYFCAARLPDRAP